MGKIKKSLGGIMLQEKRANLANIRYVFKSANAQGEKQSAVAAVADASGAPGASIISACLLATAICTSGEVRGQDTTLTPQPTITVFEEQGDNPRWVDLGDLNADGNVDLVTANNGSNDVSVLLGDGLGGFAASPGSPLTVGDGPNAVALGDVNDDGNADLVTANAGSNDISVLLGDGIGGFAPAAGSPFMAGDLPQSVTLGDVDADDNLDLITTNLVSNDVSVLLGDGTGQFTAATGSPFAVAVGPRTAAVDDVNADGNADLVVANAVSDDISVLLGDGTGQFNSAAGSPFTAGNGPHSIVLSDMDGDGNVDGVVSNAVSNDIVLLLGDGNGGFAPAAASPFAVGGLPQEVTVEDFDVDGSLDLVTANAGSNDVSVLLGDGVGGFTTATGSPFSVGISPLSVAVGDIDGDGNADLVTANERSDGLSLLLGDGDGSFTAATESELALGADPGDFAIGDFNSNGIADIVIPRASRGDVDVLDGLGNGTFRRLGLSELPSHFPVSVAVGDLNEDGNADLASANFRSNDVNVLLGDGNGGFVAASGSPFAVGGIWPVSVALSDLDADGDADLITANFFSDDASVLLGDGTGGFAASPGSPFAVGDFPESVSLGDLNSDGDSDLVTVNASSDDVSVLLGDGVGGFAAAPGSPFAVGNFPQSLALGDVDGDGDVDLVIANAGSDDVSLLVGDGAGGFISSTESPFSVGDSPESIAAGDLDADGNIDLVTANSGSNDVSVLLGDGLGDFVAVAGGPFAVGNAPQSVAVEDLDGDGLPDVIVVGDGSGSGNETMTVLTSDVLFIDSASVPTAAN